MLVTCVRVLCTTLFTNNNIKIVIKSSTFLDHHKTRVKKYLWYISIEGVPVFSTLKCAQIAEGFLALCFKFTVFEYFNKYKSQRHCHICQYFLYLTENMPQKNYSEGVRAWIILNGFENISFHWGVMKKGAVSRKSIFI